MNIPTLLIGALFATLYGAAFHLWRGGNAGRLAFYMALSWVGFWLGHFLGLLFGWSFLSVGTLRLGMATLFALIFLGGGYWLSLVKPEENEKSEKSAARDFLRHKE